MIKLVSPALRRQFAGTDAFRSPCLLSVLLVAFIVCAAASSSKSQSATQEANAAAAQDNVRTLTPGEIITQNIKGNELHTFQLMLAPKQYVHIVVEQQGVNVAVRLLDPGGHVLVKADSPNGRRGPEAVSTVAELAGSYTVEVSANKTQLAGSYELRVEGPREPTPADEKRVAAERAFWEAQELEGEGTANELTHAIEQYKKALGLWREMGDARGEGYTLSSIGYAYRALHDLEKARDNLNQAQKRLGDVQDIPGQAFALNEMGAAERDLGDPRLALENYDRALELRSSIGDQWGQAQLLNNIGNVYSRMGQQQKAIANLKLALPLWRAAGDRRMEMITLNNIAKAQWEMGNLTEAYEQYQELSKSCDETPDCDLKPFIENGLGLIYDTWSEPQAALSKYDAALNHFRAAKNKEGEAAVLDNIGMVYAALDDAQEALKYFQEALKIRQQLNEPGGEAVTQSNLGYAEMLLDHRQEALEHLNLALPLCQKSHNRYFEAYTLVRLGIVSAALEGRAKALDYYQQALKIQKEIEDRRGQAITLTLIGQVYVLSGESSQARKSFDEALQDWAAVGDKQGQATTLYGLALVERDQHNLAAARDKIEEAIGVIESLRSKIISHQLRMAYFAGRQDLYALDIDIRMRLYDLTGSRADLEAALSASERARARDLMDLLTEAHAGLNRWMSPQNAERSQRLKQEISALTESLLSVRNLKRVEDAAAIEEKLTARVLEQEKLETEIRIANPSYAKLRQPRPLEPREIQQLLDDDTLLLEYSMNKGRSYLWAVTRAGIAGHSLPGRVEIEKTANQLRQALTAYEPPKPGESAEQYGERRKKAALQYRHLALELSRMIIGPVSSQLGPKRLVIVADGALQYIPFEALPVPDTVNRNQPTAEADRYLPLILKYEIVYQPSVSTLALLRDNTRRKATKTVAVIADPVFDSNDDRVRAFAKGQPAVSAPSLSSIELGQALRDIGDSGAGSTGFKLRRLDYTAGEADAIIASAAPGSSMKAVDFKASRATMTSQALGQFSIVHLATHGILNEKHPELSGIVLSMVNEQGLPEDGYLRLRDIYNLDLPVDLVVLSACRTGIGKPVQGEGLIGLTRGFMYAGASKVVASLWNVEDEATAELMKRFYKYMFEKKMPAAAALRQAKIEMSQLQQWRAPFFWAGFIIQGDWK